MLAVDYWCNPFTPEAIQTYWRDAEEIASVVEWWGMDERIVGRTVDEFIEYLDAASVGSVLVPSVKMRSYQHGTPIWDTPEQEVAELVASSPSRLRGLFGIDPLLGMRGVEQLEKWVECGYFVGAHLHTYGFGLPLNHRRYYPFYAKCAELDVPVVMQVGHSAERMPSELARPLLVDTIALDFPELRIVAAHTGWPWVDELIAVAWKHPNVYIGTSAHHPRYWDASLVKFLRGRGVGKVMFGTDYPVLEHKDAVEFIDQMDLSSSAQNSLLHETATTVFGLDRLPALGAVPGETAGGGTESVTSP